MPLHGTGAEQKPDLHPRGAPVLAPARSQQRGRGLLPQALPAQALQLGGSRQGLLLFASSGAARRQALGRGRGSALGFAALAHKSKGRALQSAPWSGQGARGTWGF